MKTHIHLESPQTARFRQSIERQIQYKLSTFESVVRSVYARLDEGAPSVTEKDWYTCEVAVQLTTGQSYEVSTRGHHPQICIADSVSRIARHISRDLSFNRPQAAGSLARAR